MEQISSECPVSSSTNKSQIKVSSMSQSRPFSHCSSIETIQPTLHRSNLHMSVAQVNIVLTKMVLTICAFASFEHIFLTASLQMFTRYLKPVILDVIFLANLSMLLKHSINFLIFYYFNAFFKRRLNAFIFKNK